MKRIIFTLLLIAGFLFSVNPVFSQTTGFEREGYLNNVKLRDLKATYLNVSFKTAGGYTFSAQLIAMVDKNSSFITGPQGGTWNFDSIITILNFLSYNGFELMGKANDITGSSENGPDSMLFKKKIK